MFSVAFPTCSGCGTVKTRDSIICGTCMDRESRRLLMDENQRLRAALEQFGQHLAFCGYGVTNGCTAAVPHCTCGLDAAKAVK